MPIYVPGKLTLAKEFTWNETVWNPSMISTALWLDAADSSTITLNGSTVSQWNDKSGNGRHASQATAGSQPTRTLNGLNSQTVISFDGGDTLNATTLPGTTFAIYGVIATGPLTNPNEDTWLSTRTNSTQGFELGARPSGPSSVIRNFNSSTNSAIYSAQYLTEQSPFLAYASIDNASSIVTVGVNAVFNTASSKTIDASTTALRIGGPTGSSGASNWDGYVAEFIITTTIPTTIERQRIEGYLAHKWGLTANLPAGHPYKLVGPTP